MSTKDLAYSIFQQLTEEELQGFVLIFSKLHPNTNEDMERRKAAYERIMELRKPMPDLDYDKELASYREEKYGG